MKGLTDLVIVGAGGFARETASAIEAVNRHRPAWRLRGFLDDDPALHGRLRCGVPVLGPLSMMDEFWDASVVVCVGNPRDYRSRARVVADLGLAVERYATIVHPAAQVGSGCLIGPGSVLLAGVVLTADVAVGSHVAVMPQAVLTHEDVVGDFATLAAGVRLGGGVRLGSGVYVGAGSLIREHVSVGAWSLVGMGAVVLRDVPPGEVWVGNPARRLRLAAKPERNGTRPLGRERSTT